MATALALFTDELGYGSFKNEVSDNANQAARLEAWMVIRDYKEVKNRSSEVHEMSGFDQASEICKDWPNDLTAPKRLRELIDRLEGRDGGEAIGFIELLQAGTESQEQLKAYQKAFDDFELRFDNDEDVDDE